MDVTFKGYECTVCFGQYHNGNTAIQLIGKVGTGYEGELVAVASVNGELELIEDVVGIKNWSENKGIVQALVDGDVILPGMLGIEPVGFVEIEHYRLTDTALNALFDFKKEAIN